MTYKAKVVVCPEIRKKPPAQGEQHVELLNIKQTARLQKAKRVKCQCCGLSIPPA